LTFDNSNARMGTRRSRYVGLENVPFLQILFIYCREARRRSPGWSPIMWKWSCALTSLYRVFVNFYDVTILWIIIGRDATINRIQDSKNVN